MIPQQIAIHRYDKVFFGGKRAAGQPDDLAGIDRRELPQPLNRRVVAVGAGPVELERTRDKQRGRVGAQLQEPVAVAR